MSTQNTTAPTSTPLLAWIILFGLALIWGTSFILIKKGLEVYSSDELGAIRITIATIALLPFAVRGLKAPTRQQWKFLLISGLIGNLIPAFLFAYAETQLASGLAGVLNSLTALFTLIIGAIFFQQKITALRVTGIVIGIVGTAVLIFSGSSEENSSNGFYGLYVVLATILYGGSLNIIKHKLVGLKAITMASLALLTVGPLAFVYLCTTDAFHKLNTVPQAWEALGYIAILAVFSTAIGLVLYNKLIHMTGTLFASTSTYLMPIVALIWGVADGESIHLMHYVGMTVILAGVLLVNRAK
ncbi:DMT family transporter [Nibribacter koreensis]|uniref:DMT family transporter n=1 Tax=Nibribacter koreensis TaxID=1084519 RepID=A0ABP8FNY4_9BACT